MCVCARAKREFFYIEALIKWHSSTDSSLQEYFDIITHTKDIAFYAGSKKFFSK